MTQKVKCPGEGKEMFLFRHPRIGLRSRSMVGAIPGGRPLPCACSPCDGPIQLALSFANKVMEAVLGAPLMCTQLRELLLAVSLQEHESQQSIQRDEATDPAEP